MDRPRPDQTAPLSRSLGKVLRPNIESVAASDGPSREASRIAGKAAAKWRGVWQAARHGAERCSSSHAASSADCAKAWVPNPLADARTSDTVRIDARDLTLGTTACGAGFPSEQQGMGSSRPLRAIFGDTRVKSQDQRVGRGNWSLPPLLGCYSAGHGVKVNKSPCRKPRRRAMLAS